MLPRHIQGCCSDKWDSFWPNLQPKSVASEKTAHKFQQTPMAPQAKRHEIDYFLFTLWIQWMDWHASQTYPGLLQWQMGLVLAKVAAKISFWKNCTQISIDPNGSTSQTSWNRLFPLHSMDPMDGLTLCFPDISRDAAVTSGTHFGQICSQNQLLKKLETNFNGHQWLHKPNHMK